jgi:hypothetical protein
LVLVVLVARLEQPMLTELLEQAAGHLFLEPVMAMLKPLAAVRVRGELLHLLEF